MTDALEVIAELNCGVLIENTVDVFVEGPINQRLQLGLDRRIESIRNLVAEEGYELHEEDVERCSEAWANTLKRVLLNAHLPDCRSGCPAQKYLWHGELSRVPDPMCLGRTASQ